MRVRHCLVALSVLTIAAVPFKFLSPAIALEGEAHDCAGASQDAVTKLPMPLAKWGQISCTPAGHVLMSRDDWVWVMPDGSGMVFVPSQMGDKEPEEADNKSYFTKIDVKPVKGDEFNQVYRTFHIGFDDSEVKPDAYQVDLATASGKTLRMYFFDYDSYAWGMTCPDNKCAIDTRFMVLDKNHRPEPRQPAI
ncbi:MAG TPA: hypothetical protein VGM72_07170 [Micropepsaceae bacterium]|jgi:hypothetical protein